MLTVFTEEGEKEEEENDQTKARANHSTGIETTTEIEHPSTTSPTKEKGKVDKKAKDEAQVEAGTDRTLKPVATAAFQDTIPETVDEDKTMRRKSKRKHRTNKAKNQETTFRS